MDKRVVILVGPQQRANAARLCNEMPAGVMVSFTMPAKSRIQEERYHAMMGDIAKQVPILGEKRDNETVKRLLVDAFARIKAAEGDPLPGWGQIMPSLDGSGFVQLGIQTRRLGKRHASEFIEYLFAFGADHGVQWSNECAAVAA